MRASAVQWGRIFRLFLALTISADAARAVDVQNFIGSGTDAAYVEKTQISLLKKLGRLDPQADCSLTRFFWKRIDIHGQALRLGLYRFELPVKLKDARVEADVLSVLIREGGKGDALWLRVGPREDTGWIEVPRVAETLTPAERGKLFRSCLSQIDSVDSAFWTDPCQGRDECESLNFFWPQAVGNGYKLVPARRLSEQVPLGPQGVATWLLDSRRYLQEKKDPFEVEPTASRRIWKSRIWRSDLVDPVNERVFFSSNRSMEGKEEATPAEQIEPISMSPVTPQRDANCTMGSKEDDCIMIFAPWARASEGDWGFDWSWNGLPNARVPKGNHLTNAEGCLNLNGSKPGTDFAVILQNSHLEVRSLQDPRLPVSITFRRKGPYAFVEPGGNFFEVLVAANAFSWANQGLNDLKCNVYEWLPDLVRDLAIYQTKAPDCECSAERVPGRIYLPFLCPGIDGAIAKGLCRDVVVHELAHEVTGSLVELATAGQEQTLQDGTLGEALADFFALVLRSDDPSLEYAPACQNDHFKFRAGNSSFSRRNFTSALLFASNQTPSPENTVAKLVTLATLYGHSSRKDFFDTFFDFAVDKVALGEDVLIPICEAFQKNAAICDKRCPESVFCSRLEGVERIDGQLRLHGTFLGTEDCPDFTVQMISKTNVSALDTSVGAVPPWRGSGILGEFPFPMPPFTLKFKPRCEKVQTRTQTLEISALPERILTPPATALDAAQVLVADLPNGLRQLVARYHDGALWSLQGGKDEIPRQVLPDRIRQGFSVTEAGSIQGWTMQGSPITAWYLPELHRWEMKELQGVDLPTAGGTPKTVPWEWLGRPLQENPRVEILEIHPFEIKLGVWPERGKPQTLRFPFGRQIDPASLEVGLTSRGPVVSVTGRYPKVAYTYVLYEEELRPLHELAVFPLENPALSFRRDGTEVAFELLDEHSVCKAPPYLRFVEKRLLALTCDGVLASYLLDDTGPHREWLQELGGILVPIIGARPIQLGNLDGAGGPELVLGPFRHIINDTTEDWVELRDLKGLALEKLRRIRGTEKMRGAPAVIDLDHDGCDEVVTVTDKLEVWDPNANIEACRESSLH